MDDVQIGLEIVRNIPAVGLQPGSSLTVEAHYSVTDFIANSLQARCQEGDKQLLRLESFIRSENALSRPVTSYLYTHVCTTPIDSHARIYHLRTTCTKYSLFYSVSAPANLHLFSRLDLISHILQCIKIKKWYILLVHNFKKKCYKNNGVLTM